MAITRRQFLKYAAASAAALGLSELELFQLAEKTMAALPNTSRPRVIGLQGQACSGDITSLANLINSIPPETVEEVLDPGHGTDDWQHSVRATYGDAVEEYLGVSNSSGDSPTSTIDDVLIDVVNMTFQPTVCGPSGALGYVEGVLNSANNAHFLLVEGSVPVGAQDTSTVGADACNVGDQNGEWTGSNTAESMVDALTTIINKGNTTAVLAVGTCAAYGGIPAAKNGNKIQPGTKSTPYYRSSGAMSVSDALNALKTSGAITASLPAVVNIPGCPIRPDDVFLVVAQAILDLGTLVSSLVTPLDRSSNPVAGRPGSILGINLFGQTQHYHCSRRAQYIAGNFATSFADTDGKCLAVLGCKGPTTFASCQRNRKHQWNPVAGADGSTRAIHDGTWPGLTDVPALVSGGTLGTVSNDSGSSCIKKGHPCIGCKERGFPDRFAPLVDYNN